MKKKTEKKKVKVPTPFRRLRKRVTQLEKEKEERNAAEKAAKEKLEKEQKEREKSFFDRYFGREDEEE